MAGERSLRRAALPKVLRKLSSLTSSASLYSLQDFPALDLQLPDACGLAQMRPTADFGARLFDLIEVNWMVATLGSGLRQLTHSPNPLQSTLRGRPSKGPHGNLALLRTISAYDFEYARAALVASAPSDSGGYHTGEVAGWLSATRECSARGDVWHQPIL